MTAAIIDEYSSLAVFLIMFYYSQVKTTFRFQISVSNGVKIAATTYDTDKRIVITYFFLNVLNDVFSDDVSLKNILTTPM